MPERGKGHLVSSGRRGGATPDGAAGSDASASASCSDFAPPAPATAPTTVRLVNSTGSAVYLGPTTPLCDFDIGFTAEDSRGNPLKLAQGNCELRCDDLQQGTSCTCGTGCFGPPITLLAAGAHWDIGWPGTVFDVKQMPAKCFADPSCADKTCLVEKAAPTGTVTLHAAAYTQPVCPGGPCTSCTPGATGNCTIFGATNVTGTAITGSATWTGSGTVTITLQ